MKVYNEAPYYDDFDESKGFYQILFKPGLAVQARELTQLQTILRNQINKFGSHIFEDGSIVAGGQTYLYDTYFINLKNSGALTEEGTVITGSTSGARGKIIRSERIDAETFRIYFSYISSTKFERGEIISSDANNTYVVSNEDDFNGRSTVFGINDSIFFIKGSFVFCEAQTYVFGTDFITSNIAVGLNVEESIVTYQEDDSLLDNASGFSNYTARGADRFSISLTPVGYIYDPITGTIDINSDNFIELMRISKGEIVKQITSADYSALEDTLARRTYDESGDYTTKPFSIKIIENRQNDDDKLTIKIFPGKAYVKGYEFETIAPTYIDIDKARDTKEITGSITQADYGSFLYVQTPAGYIDYNSNPVVQLRSTASPDALVATANIYGIEYSSSGIYKLYLYNIEYEEGFKNLSQIEVVRNSGNTWSATVDKDSYESEIPSLVTNLTRSSILKLQNQNIETFLTGVGGSSDTQFVAYRTFTATFSDVGGDYVSTISTGSANEQFISNDPNEWMVVDTSGNSYTVVSVTGSGTSRTVEINASVAGAKVFAKVGVNAAVQRNKTLSNSSLTGISITSDRIYLNVADCFRLISVIAKDTAVSNPAQDLDVTNRFNFNNGQKDDLYDHGWIQLKSNQSIPSAYDELDIQFTYFEHSTYDGFFSSDSYSGQIDYADIPSYTSEKGTVFKLNSCLDFRPIRAPGSGSTAINGGDKAAPESTVSADYRYYLSRIDKLVVSKEKRFKIIKGIAADVPSTPSDELDSMTIYSLNIPAFTKNENSVSYTYVDNRRYTMRDIGTIDRRVKRIEYYTALSMLEKQANEQTLESTVPGIERFKNGILVDSFTGHGIGNVGNPDYSCSIDKTRHILRPRFSPQSFRYNLNSISSNLTQEKDLIHLDYDTEVFVTQPEVTNWVNANPYMVFSWNGSVELTPATDNWVDTHVLPDVVVNLNGENDVFTVLNQDAANQNSLGVLWDDWRTVIKGAVTGIENEYNSESNLSTITDEATGEQTLQSDIKITNKQTITTTDSQIRTGIDVLTSDTRAIQTNLGTKVVDTSIIPYIRSQTIKFVGRNLKPQTRLYAIFDGVNITDYCESSIEIAFTNLSIDDLDYTKATKVRDPNDTSVSADVLIAKGNRAFIQIESTSTGLFTVGDFLQWYIDGSWVVGGTLSEIIQNGNMTTNVNGDIAGYFFLPSSTATNIRFRTGEPIFRLSDSLSDYSSTAAEVKFVAQGLSQSTERTIIATRVQSATVKAVNDIKTSSTTGVRNITVADVSSSAAIPSSAPPNAEIPSSVPPNAAIPSSVPPNAALPIILECGQTQSSSGTKGTFQYEVDFGSGTGTTGIEIAATNGVPVKYTLNWEGRDYTTGFIGDSSYNRDLAVNGYEPVNPSRSYNSSETFNFNKYSGERNKGYLIIESPIAGSNWSVKVKCSVEPPVDNFIFQALMSSIGDRKLSGDSLNIAWSPWGSESYTDAPMGQSKNLGGPISTSWTGSKGTFEISENVKYKLTNITCSDSRFKFFINEQQEIYTGQGVKSATPFNVDYYPAVDANGNPTDLQGVGSTYPGFENLHTWPIWIVNPPNEMTDTNWSSENIVKSKGQSVNVYMVFNPHAQGSEGPLFIGKHNLRDAIKGIGPEPVLIDPEPIQFTVTATWEYVSGDDSIPTNERTLTISKTGTLDISQATQFDPVAQTFFIDAAQYPNGIYVKSLDLYFKSKSVWAPIEVQLRPVVNGYPSSNTIMPFGSIVKDANSINVSDDASISTRFEFPNIIHLSPGEYCFVAITNTDEYELYTSVIGEFSLNNPERRISEQPLLGSLFKSQNASTWTPVQEEDIKFELNKCVFNGNTGQIVLETDVSSLSSDVSFDVFFTDGETVEFPDTTVNYAYNINNEGYVGYQLGSNITLNTPKTLEFDDPSSVRFRAEISSSDPNVTPIIDINRLSNVLVKNIINGIPEDDGSSPSPREEFLDSELESFGGQSEAKYISRTVKLASGFESRDLAVYLDARKPSGTDVKVYYKVSTSDDNIFDDNIYTEMVLDTTYSDRAAGDFVEYKYRTDFNYNLDPSLQIEPSALPDGTKFDSFAIKIVMLSDDSTKVPEIRNLRAIALDE